MCDGRTDGPTDGRTDTPSYRDARMHLKNILSLNTSFVYGAALRMFSMKGRLFNLKIIVIYKLHIGAMRALLTNCAAKRGFCDLVERNHVRVMASSWRKNPRGVG